MLSFGDIKLSPGIFVSRTVECKYLQNICLFWKYSRCCDISAPLMERINLQNTQLPTFSQNTLIFFKYFQWPFPSTKMPGDKSDNLFYIFYRPEMAEMCKSTKMLYTTNKLWSTVPLTVIFTTRYILYLVFIIMYVSKHNKSG